jgi:hypothetical protein
LQKYLRKVKRGMIGGFLCGYGVFELMKTKTPALARR